MALSGGANRTVGSSGELASNCPRCGPAAGGPQRLSSLTTQGLFCCSRLDKGQGAPFLNFPEKLKWPFPIFLSAATVCRAGAGTQARRLQPQLCKEGLGTCSVTAQAGFPTGNHRRWVSWVLNCYSSLTLTSVSRRSY